MDHDEEQLKIFKKYPSMFIGVNQPSKYSCMAFGLEVNPGWYSLIENMCDEIYQVSSQNNFTVVFDQIKEKFGALRVYYNVTECEKDEYLDMIDKIIFKYEKLSTITCDVCGKPGKLGNNGWHMTRCEEHITRYELD
jgi:hypothetical protein